MKKNILILLSIGLSTSQLTTFARKDAKKHYSDKLEQKITIGMNQEESWKDLLDILNNAYNIILEKKEHTVTILNSWSEFLAEKHPAKIFQKSTIHKILLHCICETESFSRKEILRDGIQNYLKENEGVKEQIDFLETHELNAHFYYLNLNGISENIKKDPRFEVFRTSEIQNILDKIISIELIVDEIVTREECENKWEQFVSDSNEISGELISTFKELANGALDFYSYNAIKSVLRNYF